MSGVSDSDHQDHTSSALAYICISNSPQGSVSSVSP